MKFKYLFFSLLVTLNFSFSANDFTLPKNAPVSSPASNKGMVNSSAKKIKEQILELISQILKINLVELDRILIDLRVYLQDEFEAGLCGEHQTLINSSSKSQRQAYLDLMTQLNLELANSIKVVEQKINEIKLLKTGKLKG